MPEGSVGIEFQRLAKCGLGLRVAVDRQQRDAEVAVGTRPQRIALDGLVRQVDRFIPASEGQRLDAGVPERLGVAGFQVQCFAKAGVRGRPVPVVEGLNPAHRQMRVSELGIERQRLLRGLARPSIAVGGRHETVVGLPCVCLRQARPGRGVARIALE